MTYAGRLAASLIIATALIIGFLGTASVAAFSPELTRTLSQDGASAVMMRTF